MQKSKLLYSSILLSLLVMSVLFAATPMRLPHEIEPIKPEFNTDPAAPAPIDPDACEDDYWEGINQCEDDKDFDEAVCDGEFAACMENFPGLPMFGLLFCGPEKETCYGDAYSNYKTCVCQTTMEAVECMGEITPGQVPINVAACILLWPPGVPVFHPAPEPDPNRFTV